MAYTGARSTWQRWLHQPQTDWLRRVVFQLHLWTGLSVGVYIWMISVTGSLLVYRDDLFRIATPPPIVLHGNGHRLTDPELRDAATQVHPGFTVTRITRARNPDQAVTLALRRGAEVQSRLFDPYTGKDLGNAVPFGIWLVSKLLELHDDLLGGRTGRKVNGLGAGLALLLACTGIVIWWPGIKTWRRHLTIHRGVGWRRFLWELHGVIGFWSLGFLMLFGVSGLYLANPQPFQDLADRLQPLTPQNADSRLVDQVMYWLAYVHFGRLGGRGISWCGRGLCNSVTKATWAAFGLAPAGLFVSGALVWWNRVLRPRTRVDRAIRASSSRTTARMP
jgi:uncharacterized iron-regulated membrane protein